MQFVALESEIADRHRAGAPDANGQTPERTTSPGGAPCRHCLRDIEAGAPMLVLAHRPFPTRQPYAEVGPIFLCAEPCVRHPEEGDAPEILGARENGSVLVKGYDENDRIVYGTGAITPVRALADRIEALFDDPRVAYAHLRSASNNCYFCRIDRA